MIKRITGLLAPQRAALGSVYGLGSADRDADTDANANGPEPADRLLIGLAVLTLLAELAEDGPVLCLVDDAHWIDQSSLAALVFAARRLDDESIAVLFGAREGHGTLDSCGLPVLRPAELSETAARALLDQRRRGISASDKSRILAQAHGNPLALLELPLRPGPAAARPGASGGSAVTAPTTSTAGTETEQSVFNYPEPTGSAPTAPPAFHPSSALPDPAAGYDRSADLPLPERLQAAAAACERAAQLTRDPGDRLRRWVLAALALATAMATAMAEFGRGDLRGAHRLAYDGAVTLAAAAPRQSAGHCRPRTGAPASCSRRR